MLASHLVEWAVGAAPENVDALSAKRDVYAARLEAERNLMAAGIYRSAMNDARAALGDKKLSVQGRAKL